MLLLCDDAFFRVTVCRYEESAIQLGNSRLKATK